MRVEDVFHKYEKLKGILRSYENVAIAFSGGVDSTFLLYAAGDALNRDNVTAFHGSSCLNCSDSNIKEFYKKHVGEYAKLKVIELDPFSWPEFVCNDDKRCYYCKKMTYFEFIDNMKGEVAVLLDGTNLDDLSEDRPGLQVLKELGVKTPLVAAGFKKKDIRFLARVFGLPNHSVPSNSCMATRLKHMPTIAKEDLLRIAEIEKKLIKHGFSGCRAKPKKKSIIIEVRQQDFVKIAQRHNRLHVLDICKNAGYEEIFLDIAGRH